MGLEFKVSYLKNRKKLGFSCLSACGSDGHVWHASLMSSVNENPCSVGQENLVFELKS